MTIFILMYICFALIAIIAQSINLKRQKLFICISCFIVLWLIQALRDTTIGVDSFGAYLPYFNNSTPTLSTLFRGDSDVGFETGYIIYNNIIKLFITSDEHVFLAITSFLVLFPISFIIYRYSKKPLLSFIIFSSFIIYFVTFSGLRQALAISLISLSFYYLVNEKFWKFFVLVFIASTIHTSALIFIFLYPLRKIKLKNSLFIFIIPLILVIIFNLKTTISSILNNIFPEGKYIGYINQEVVASYNLMILLFIVFIAMLQFNKNILINRIFIWASFLAFMCQGLGLISTTATRIGYYFIFINAISIPSLIDEFKCSSTTKLYISIGVCAFCVFFFFYANSNGYLNVIPYKFFWD